MKTLLTTIVLLTVTGSLAGAPEPFTARTRIGLSGKNWTVNEKPTYPGSTAEGLLLNVRMASALFEDRNDATRPKDFDAEKNTGAFIARIPEYVAQGVIAFTLSLQGGDPGYAGARCSAFEADGSLREGYRKRAERAIEACDRAGAAVILTCFHEGQDQILTDDASVKKAVEGTARWIKERGYRNVLLEIADESLRPGYKRMAIRSPDALKGLLKLAKETAPGLLVASSGGGGGRVAKQIQVEGSFLLVHFSAVPVDDILKKVAAADKVSKAVVCNADSKVGEEGAKALEAAVNAIASYGYGNGKCEKYPFRYEGAKDDPPVYAKFKELTTPAK